MIVECFSCHEKFDVTRRSVIDPFICAECENAPDLTSIPDATGVSVSSLPRTAALIYGTLSSRYGAGFVGQTTPEPNPDSALIEDLQTQLEAANGRNESLDDVISDQRFRIDDLRYRNEWQAGELEKLVSALITRETELTNEKSTNSLLSNNLSVANDTITELKDRNVRQAHVVIDLENQTDSLNEELNAAAVLVRAGRLVAEMYVAQVEGRREDLDRADEQFTNDAQVILALNLEIKNLNAALDTMSDKDWHRDRHEYWKKAWVKVSKDYATLVEKTSRPWTVKVWEWVVAEYKTWNLWGSR